jgi:hypothetical protein
LSFPGIQSSESKSGELLRIWYVTASAHRKLKGVLETHDNRGVGHHAVKSAVRALKAKVACCKFVIGE